MQLPKAVMLSIIFGGGVRGHEHIHDNFTRRIEAISENARRPPPAMFIGVQGLLDKYLSDESFHEALMYEINT